MKTILTLIAFLFSPLTLTFVYAGALKDDVLNNSVYIRTHEAIGSGVVFEHKGEVFVMTAAHVVSGCMKPRVTTFVDEKGETVTKVDKTPLPVYLEWKDGTTTDKARVVWYSEGWEDGAIDLALLKLPPELEKRYVGLAARLLTTDHDALEEGEDTWYCGSGGGIPFSLDKSIVNRLEFRYMITNGIGWYGHSGSGVFVKRGEHYFLAGILTQFVQVPRENLRSPLACERELLRFLETFTRK